LPPNQLPHTCADAGGHARTRTPPAIKWLLNERAALAGEAQRLKADLERIQRELPAVLGKLAAMDATMAAINHRVAPDAAGTVKAWAGKYGERGAVKACVLTHLQAAGKAGIDVSTLALQVAAALGVNLPTKKDFSAFRRDTVHAVLKRAKADGLTEVLIAARGGHTPQVWRWKGPRGLPGLAALQDIANKGAVRDPDQNPGHRKVATQ